MFCHNEAEEETESNWPELRIIDVAFCTIDLSNMFLKDPPKLQSIKVRELCVLSAERALFRPLFRPSCHQAHHIAPSHLYSIYR